VDPHVGEPEQGAGCEGDGAVFVVRVETGLRGLLPAGGPRSEGSAVGREVCVSLAHET
jgi:hypothetical protein